MAFSHLGPVLLIHLDYAIRQVLTLVSVVRWVWDTRQVTTNLLIASPTVLHKKTIQFSNKMCDPKSLYTFADLSIIELHIPPPHLGFFQGQASLVPIAHSFQIFLHPFLQGKTVLSKIFTAENKGPRNQPGASAFIVCRKGANGCHRPRGFSKSSRQKWMTLLPAAW